jgi:D-alanine-D-alanine ligase
MSKMRIGILFGGKSAEHEMSLQSARNIISALNPDKYEVVLIGMDKQGRWYLDNSSRSLLNATNPALTLLNNSHDELALVPGKDAHQIVSTTRDTTIGTIDVAFPVLHGPFGEDGTVQGMLKLANIPFVGASVLGSAIGMDKDVTKRLLRDAGIRVPDFVVLKDSEDADYESVASVLGPVVFVKPANLGSSVGISKVASGDEFAAAVSKAFKYDRKVLVEEYVRGREIEVSVLGNANSIASLPGEVIPKDGFYSYEAKYIDEHGARLEIPAKLTPDLVAEFQEIAVKAFGVLCCEGMARVDFFLGEDSLIYLNEINTIPGFTNISMYPKLWEASGIGYEELIDRLIVLAIERFEKERKLKTEY